MALGLQQKFALSLLLSGLIVLAVLLGLWHSGTRTNMELVSQTSSVMRDQAWLSLQRRGEVTARFLAETLPNPLYYYDLQSIREVARSALDQRDVRYVLIYDSQGRILHDGSRDIPRFGELMDDEHASAAIASNETLMQWGEQVLDISSPIFLGRERIGGVRVGVSRTEVEAAIALEQAALSERLQVVFLGQLRFLMLAFALLLISVAVMGWMVSRGLVRPIRELASAAKRLETGSYDVSLESRRRDELGALVRAFSRMAASVRDHDQDIRRLAYQDTLTGLPNRLMFREMLDELMSDYASTEQGVGLLFIDLDDFKRINDTLGHDAGDEVLGDFARRLQHCVHQMAEHSKAGSGAMVARLGGDEFVALVPGSELVTRCDRLATQVLDLLQQPFTVAERSLFLSASIGIAVFPDDAHNAKLLLKCGDLAMYQAKQLGKNCYSFFSNRLTQAADQRLELEQDLLEALQRGEISVAYQPIVSMKDGQLLGAEALLRWEHPERGPVPPDVFIPVAERSSLIERLGSFVMKQACSDAVLWQQHRPGLHVAVNVSARQLKRSGLVELVGDALRQTGLPGTCLNLELTESSLLLDQELASDTLARIRALGAEIWLDDFGTGFSGLSHLRKVHVDGVKIDRSFVSDVLIDADDLALTSAIIAMAHSLGMRVVGEGVENEEQYQLLRERNCDYGQGFWFGPALSAADFTQALIERSLANSLE